MRRPLARALLAALVVTACGDDGATPPMDAGRDARPPDDGGGGPDVTMIGDDEALVSWVAPETRADGAALEAGAIGGYRVHYGTAPRRYDTTLDVGRASSARVTGLSRGRTYYFAVTAYDVDDRESGYSDEAEKSP